MAKIPGEVVFTPPKPKPATVLPNPWNINIPGSGLASNNGTGQAIPLVNPPAPVAAPVAAPAPAPAPVNYMALALQDPQYTQGSADIQRHNTDSLADMLKGYLSGSQSAQDSANAHGALFSGAAVNAQTQAAQNYATAQQRQAANVLSDTKGLQFNVFNRLMQQLAAGGQ